MRWNAPGFMGPLSREVENVLRILERTAAKQNEDLYVTHGRDGRHGCGTLHYQGDAADILPMKRMTAHDIQTALGIRCPGIQVIEEEDHVHLEYDPK